MEVWCALQQNYTFQPKTHAGINTLVSELCGVGDAVLAAFRGVDLASLSFSMAALRVTGDPSLTEVCRLLQYQFHNGASLKCS